MFNELELTGTEKKLAKSLFSIINCNLFPIIFSAVMCVTLTTKPLESKQNESCCEPGFNDFQTFFLPLNHEESCLIH